MNTFAAGSALSKQQSGRLTLRSFLAEVEADDPCGLCRIAEPVNADFNITALAMELEKMGRAPALWFQNVRNQRFSIVANLFGLRRRYALALGIAEDKLIDTWAKGGDETIEPLLINHGPVQDVVLTGADVDLGYLPVMKHFEQDAGPYITNAMVIAKDPDTGVRNASFHRMQVKGRTRMGTSLHSRRHLWNYVQRNDQHGRDTPIAIVIGSHPLITFGGLWKGSIETDEYAIIGGLLREPLEIVRGRTVPIDVPAQAEFVIEGRILAGTRESEGPFAEFTGYASERSTQHVVEVSAITHRNDAIYQDIIPGISDEHTSLLAVPQEARLLRMLRQQYPNVTTVAYPKSGTCRLHAHIAMRQPAPGQARNAAAAALGDDLSLKLVVVVDDDVNVHSDTEILWAMATRMQADADIDVIHNAMGAILDPSNRNGLTAKMIVDATRPASAFPARHTLPPKVAEWAHQFASQLGTN